VRILAVACLLAFPLACGGTHGGREATVRHVVDGDTIVLTDGSRVRLVQLDAPEIHAGECFARPARRALEALIPQGTDIEVETDPALDQQDEFDRVLAYVWKDDTNINLELVRLGAAAPWFYRGDRGRHADELLAAGRAAREQRRGLWGFCPETDLDPLHPIEARP
jgi:micrococcal nuclease